MARKPKTVCQGHAANLETIIDAAKRGRLALMEVRRNSDGATVAALCAVNIDNGEYEMVPLATMVEGNPYELFAPPVPAGGFAGQ